tara:strand:+ start:54 stop:224 length:171 start_codon:yes stop_codon:yes gene_type:complete
MSIKFTSPLWVIPVGLISLLILIEGIHITMHGKYCKTEAEWMNEQGLEYDRESNVE